MISVQDLGKRYILRHQTSGARPQYQRLSEVIAANAKKLFQPKSKEQKAAGKEEFWALDGVSFDINEGEVVGIIGRNGAGKSTLLKLLSRITDPTKGRFELRGRVAALLEVGTGFHPELTGRENIFLNGAVLGMHRSEIRKKFDEIVNFANVEKFLDTPVKRYSSGMSTRLAFSVAAHLDPEILIIDEVLAVGDYDFQRKCLGKMKEVSKSGRTVLFVSHNLSTVATLTNRCIQLHKGKLLGDGPTGDVVHNYVRAGLALTPVYTATASPERPTITRVEVISSEESGLHNMGAALEIQVEIETPTPIRRACLSVNVINTDTTLPVQHMWIFDAETPWGRTAGKHRLSCIIQKSHLFIGDYALNVHFAEGPGGLKFDRLENICPFEVQNLGDQRAEYPYRNGEAILLEDFQWEVH